YGSKPIREINKDTSLSDKILANLRSYEDAVAYPPNQVFIGNMRPESLTKYERPWTNKKAEDAARFSPMGEIMSEKDFYGFLKIADQYDLVFLETNFFNKEVMTSLKEHPLLTEEDVEHLNKSKTATVEEINEKINEGA